MAHSDPLTQEEFSQYRLNPELLRYIEECRASLGLKKKEMHILDWGCGRGRSMAKLLQEGYDVYGVDIDDSAMELGRAFFLDNGLDFDGRVSLVKADGSVELPNNHFHFIYSLQVLEHVESLDAVVAEMHRVTKPGGMGLHIFPSQFRPIEGHLFMPFVHWLPKNKLRKMAIYSCVAVGLEPKWQRLAGCTIHEKAACYNDFSVRHTFYRDCNSVRSAFSELNFDASFVSLEHPSLQKNRVFRKMLAIKPVSAVSNWALLNCKTVELKTIKRRMSVSTFRETRRNAPAAVENNELATID